MKKRPDTPQKYPAITQFLIYFRALGTEIIPKTKITKSAKYWVIDKNISSTDTLTLKTAIQNIELFYDDENLHFAHCLHAIASHSVSVGYYLMSLNSLDRDDDKIGLYEVKEGTFFSDFV